MPQHRLQNIAPTRCNSHHVSNCGTYEPMDGFFDRRFYFEHSQLDPTCVLVYRGESTQRMTIVRSKWRPHHWHLVSSGGKMMASFRAGRIFSYIVLQLEFGRCQMMVSINSDMISGRDDWRLPMSSEVLRWTSNGSKMVKVLDRRTELPALAALHPTGASLMEHQFPQSMMLHWEQPRGGQIRESDVPIVLCTAFISMFKWSKMLPIDIPWLSRICHNLDYEHIAQSLMTAVARYSHRITQEPSCYSRSARTVTLEQSR